MVLPSSERTPEEDLLVRLTRRERQTLALILDGHDTAAIAHVLGTSTSTVRNHVRNLTVRLGVDSRLAAVALVLRVHQRKTGVDVVTAVGLRA